MAINSQRLRTTRQMVESKFSRRQLLALLAGGVLATLPASCSPGSSNDSRLGPSGHVDGEALHYASLRDVARLIETKQVSPVELTRMMLERYPARADEYGPYFRDFLAHGAEVTDAAYADASRLRDEFSDRLHTVLSNVDAVAIPSGRPPFPVSSELQRGRMAELNDVLQFPSRFTNPANLAGTPTLSLPCGFSERGLPHTIQFMGSRLSEPMLCRIGHAYEEATGWHERHPDV